MYTIKDGKIYGYTAGQEDLYQQRIDSEGHDAISDEKAKSHLECLSVLERRVNSAIDGVFKNNFQKIASLYTKEERDTWSIQVSEARNYLSSGDNLETPFINEVAMMRGIEKKDLAERIVHNDKDYRRKIGGLLGVRQKHADEVREIMLLPEEQAMQALRQYDVYRYWDDVKLD